MLNSNRTIMFTNKTTMFLSVFAAALLVTAGCEKVVKGFLSDNIYYLENPYTVQQGSVSVSSSLATDGSTAPLQVKLLSVKNLATGEPADSILLKPDTIRVYKDAVTDADSTLALLNAKIKDSALAPFSVNPLGGRLQFTQATGYVPTGKYAIDIAVSNVRGSRTISNACIINIIPSSTEDSLYYKALSSSNSAEVFTSLPASALSVTIRRNAAGPNKIILVFKDENGHTFNPANGEVTHRSQRPSFADWNPFYPEIKTDTSFEYQYPAGVPQIPVFSSLSKYSGYAQGIMYYRVQSAATASGLSYNPVATILYYATKGTYYVTYQMSGVVRKS